jgi:prefoldin subunit 5
LVSALLVLFQNLELEVLKSKSAEEAAVSQVESLTHVKESLKNKLREYRSRMETLIDKHQQLGQVTLANNHPVE